MKYLVRATENDLLFINGLAREIWQATYVENLGQEQVDYMLNLFYSHDAMRKNMEQGHNFYIIKTEGKQIGYLDLEQKQDNLFIHKFYIDNSIQKKGLGSEVMKEIISELAAEGEKLKLHVNRQNFKAINFYFKNGFIIESLGDFDIGGGYFMRDFVMVKR